MQEGYLDGKPLLLCQPSNSIFHVVDIPQYRSLSSKKLLEQLPPKQMMEVLSSGKVIVIRHEPNTDFDSFSDALDAISERDQILELQGRNFR